MSYQTQQNFPALDLFAIDLSNPFLPAQASLASAGKKYLFFLLNGEFFALAAEYVAEVNAQISLTFLPHAPEWLLGVAPLRGEIISIVNLKKLLLQKNLPPAPRSKFIVLNAPETNLSLALAVDKLSEIAVLHDGQIEFPEDENSTFIFGKAVFQSKTARLIDAKKLISSITGN